MALDHRTFNLRLEPAVLEWLKKYAEENNRTVTGQLRTMIKEEMKRANCSKVEDVSWN
ncbi:Arc family DNA-binding protein [Spartinivicinus ruber]|uniref:Arc family DNA-binding protein n=1 Tax=Spartinivicinus ruber TaxID=2683272 RepID=UPI0013D46F46|nr:Arc family DNA-binding protein [Spartinivicinus ruber]